MGFQTTVQSQQAPACAGDFASGNPRAATVSPEGGFVAGAAGVTVGRFAWIQSDGVTVLNTGTGKPDGFIHREQQALISTYLAESGNLIPVGFPVTLMRTGDYYALANVAAASKGQRLTPSSKTVRRVLRTPPRLRLPPRSPPHNRALRLRFPPWASVP